MSWTAYQADRYLDVDEVEAFCRALADAHPEWVELETMGQTRQGRPLLLLTLGAASPGPDGARRGSRPALWLDAGTHASEWTGISAVVYAISRWIERLEAGDRTLAEWFERHDVLCMPCISPDGVQAMVDGAPYIRSSLSPPQDGQVRSGLDPCDVDGDGRVRMMRWKHPAGSFVDDPDWAPFMRPRSLDDDPADAYFLCDEGEFINWDGTRWTAAPLAHGIDLNRNFPAAWHPFSMFGMHAGRFPLSEPESRAVVDAFAGHGHIACALTMHTYTGCILTQPYREDTPLDQEDIRLMEALAEDLVEGTGYRVFRVYPEFMYDKDRPIPGVWADTMSTVFGVPGYTIELWDPFGHADVELDAPTEFFRKPDLDKTKRLLQKFAATPDNVAPWRPVEHPQLGAVEIGGIEYLRTIRNPPDALLRDECDKAFAMIERSRRALPRVEARAQVTPLGDGVHRVRLVLENTGFLPSSGLSRGAQIGASPGVSVRAEVDGPLQLDGAGERELDHLLGWGALRVGAAKHPVYAGLPIDGSHRQYAEWTVRGQGTLRLHWQAGRAGRDTLSVELPPDEG